MTISSVTNITLQETLNYRDFKEAGAKGIDECKIRSIILPLLADMSFESPIITLDY